MSKGKLPIKIILNLEKGFINPFSKKTVRRASDMLGVYSDIEANRRIIKNRNPIIYEFYESSLSRKKNDLSFAMTIIYPGKIGSEYHMTKGHIHIKPSPEIYIGVKGKGLVLMEKGGNLTSMKIGKGAVVYIPSHYAHRTINIGKDNLVFLSIYFSDAGHDYKSIIGYFKGSEKNDAITCSKGKIWSTNQI